MLVFALGGLAVAGAGTGLGDVAAALVGGLIVELASARGAFGFAAACGGFAAVLAVRLSTAISSRERLVESR